MENLHVVCLEVDLFKVLLIICSVGHSVKCFPTSVAS